jgi:hypothetical protein
MEVIEHNAEQGYNMGVYLCLGQPIHMVSPISALSIDKFPSFSNIHQHMSIHGKVFIFLGNGIHKIKKKAEQIACEVALAKLNQMV